jgi:hypothetical protein
MSSKNNNIFVKCFVNDYFKSSQYKGVVSFHSIIFSIGIKTLIKIYT